jgi:hypothetical protein
MGSSAVFDKWGLVLLIFTEIIMSNCFAFHVSAMYTHFVLPFAW